MASAVKVTFSDHFNVSSKTLEKEGFFDISLVSDLPLFIDPFHLFYSDKKEYQKLHEEIIKYLVFLRDLSISLKGRELSKGILDAYYRFPEIKQNWFGFTFIGNSGHGLGAGFAKALNNNFQEFFNDFGIGTEARHLEKLTLIADRVGRDTISDFTTNLIIGYLVARTQEFTLKHISPKNRREFSIDKASFDYTKKVWVSKKFTLPLYQNDFVLLTPRDLLRRTNTWINKDDLVSRFSQIPSAISDASLREQLSNFFNARLNEFAVKKIDKKTNEVVLSFPEKTKKLAAMATIAKFPESIDAYIKIKEKDGDEAVKESDKLVSEVEEFLANQFRNFVSGIEVGLRRPTSYEEAHERAIYFKECIELRDLWKNLYKDDEPVDEEWIQRMFWLVWFGSSSDVNRDPNNGLGMPDYVVSQGSKDKALIEFKLARSSSLEKNLKNQLKKYKEVNKAKSGVWVIIFFTANEEKKVKRLLKQYGFENDPDYILVDARKDNKISASKIS